MPDGRYTVEVVRRGGGAGEEQGAAQGPDQPAGDQQPALADPTGQASEHRGGDGHDHRTDRDGEAGGQDRVVPHPGQEQHVAEEHGAEAGGVDEHGGVAPAEVVGAEQPEVDERVLDPPAAGDEHGEQQAAGGQGQGEAGAGPAPRVGLHDGVGDQGDAGGQHDDAERVGQPAGVLLPTLGQHGPTEEEADDADGQVDEERPPPAQVAHHEGAEGRPGGAGDGADGAPDGHRHGDLVAREGLQHERERRRHQDGGAHGFEHLGADEHADGGGETAQHRADGEHHHADEEHLAAPDPVGQPAGGDQQGGEHQGVGVEHPRHRRRARRREGLADGGERHEADRRVEEDGEHGEAGGDEHDPRVAFLRRRDGDGVVLALLLDHGAPLRRWPESVL